MRRGRYSVAKFVQDIPELAGHNRRTVAGWLALTEKRLLAVAEEEQEPDPERQVQVELYWGHYIESGGGAGGAWCIR